ncbi:MAG: B12-binding domain-containing radical SAM protein [Syntrophomonadaceae bacterium]
MNIVFSTLNARFSHSSLSLASLAASCRGLGAITIHEYTINQAHPEILADLFLLHPDIICFSCYIWNIEKTLALCYDLKIVSPDLRIILGGPEVSFETKTIMKHHPEIDFIVKGEGEAVLNYIISRLTDTDEFSQVEGLCWRDGDNIYTSENLALVKNFSELPRPAYEQLASLKDRIIYYESSRGCPFNCTYCLSSTVPGVRFLPLARVQEDLKYLLSIGARQIKFVDRTFNADERRAIHIMEFILGQDSSSKFHFEIRAELLSDSFINFLKSVPPGRFYFEIGIQSTCPEALQAVNRPASWDKSRSIITQLRLETAVHLHLDLIAGLPREDLNRFKESFNQVLGLAPHVLQLGFLKLLKGSPLAIDADRHGYAFQEQPPYQILKNNYLSYQELVLLQDIEEVLERYYNSQVFYHTIGYLIENWYRGDAFRLFQDIAHFWREKDCYLKGHKRDEEYSLLYEFANLINPPNIQTVKEYLKFDYLQNQGPRHMPSVLQDGDAASSNELAYNLVKNEELVMKFIPHLKKASIGDRRRRIHLEIFSVSPLTGAAAPCAHAVLFVYPPGSPRAKDCFLVNTMLLEATGGLS